LCISLYWCIRSAKVNVDSCKTDVTSATLNMQAFVKKG